jgi:hypothetical protein
MRGERLRALVLLAAASAGISCGRGRGRGKRILPSQISIEMGSSAAVPQALLPRLTAMGVRSFFVPALKAASAGESAALEKIPPPAEPNPLPVYLEVAGSGDFDAYFQARKDKAGDEIWRAVAGPVGSPAYGRVQGLHLSLRVSRAAEEYAEALGRIRRKLPSSLTLSASVFSAFDEQQLKKWGAVARKVDFLVPEIFGRVPDAGVEGFRVAADLNQLGSWDTPHCPLLSPQGWGILKVASGAPAAAVSDLRVNELSEDRRFDFAFGSILSNADEDEYVFTARQAVRDPAWGSPPAAEGDSITFRERRVSDLTAALAQSRAAAARIIRLDSLDDQDHLIGFSVLEDVLLGKPLSPRLTLSRSGRAGAATFMAVNAAAEFSQLSRIGNWIDLRLSDAVIGDVRPGDFDRYEFLDAEGNRVPAGRAKIIRFYENFVAPGESMTAGPIRYSGNARFFGSSRLTLPDGQAVQSAETEIQGIPEGAPPEPSAQPLSGRGERPRGRKR